MLQKIVIGCISNDSSILEANLMTSPVIRSGVLETHIEVNPETASKACNRILKRTGAAIVIFAHHDVYLPEGWEQILVKRIAEVEAVDPNWGVIAAYGVDKKGLGWGPVWSSSIGRIVGRISLKPVPIQSMDELLFVVRQREGLVFDDDLPHFHFYGLDLVQTALAGGYGAWNVALPLIHNDRFKGGIDADYDRCFHYVRKKWRAKLPLKSPTVVLSWHGLNLLAKKRHMKNSFDFRRNRASGTEINPQIYAELCGWGTLRSG